MDADGPQLATPFDEDARTTIAPAWHTAVLLAGIAAIAIHGASRLPAAANLNRLATMARQPRQKQHCWHGWRSGCGYAAFPFAL